MDCPVCENEMHDDLCSWCYYRYAPITDAELEAGLRFNREWPRSTQYRALVELSRLRAPALSEEAHP